MQETIVRLALGLVCVMSSNILLGGASAKLCGEFEQSKLTSGMKKAALVLTGSGLMYIAARLNPSIVVLESSDGAMTLMDGLHFIMLTGFIFYAAQTLSKLAQIIGVKLGEKSGGEDL